MLGFCDSALLWFRFGHFVGLVCWMAGLFYLPRLFVYHMEHYEAASIFQTMERRLYRYIIVPSCCATWFCGFVLAVEKSVWVHFYFYIKLLSLFALTFFQICLNRYRIKILTEKISSVFFRAINEIPTILLFIIVYCAVFKPFKN